MHIDFALTPAHASFVPTFTHRCTGSTPHVFDVTAKDRFEFVDMKAICPECGAQGKRYIPVPVGEADRVERDFKPHYNWQIPLRKDQKPGEINIRSKAELHNIMAGSLDGQRWERNAI